MNLRLQFDNSNIDWDQIPEILQEVSMGFHPAETHKIAFNNSYAVLFVFDEDKLIGFGRAISDGTCQAALYDVAVRPAYQGKGIGKMVVSHLMERCRGCNFILYASPGKEPFYEKLRFRKMKTGMALFVDSEKKRERGFTE